MARGGDTRTDTTTAKPEGRSKKRKAANFTNVETTPGSELTVAEPVVPAKAAPRRQADGEPRSILAAAEAELATGPDPARKARLHYNIALELDNAGRLDEALAQYQEALDANPEHLPSIRRARRNRIAAGLHQAALPLFDSEIKLTSDPRAKAMLHYGRGRLLEDSLGDHEAARKAYREGVELDGTNAALLKALERLEVVHGQWKDVAEVLHREANAIRDDPRHRAVLITERARVLERNGRGDASAELLVNALRLDKKATGPAHALERLYQKRGEWQALADLFEKNAAQTNDRSLAAIYLRRAARIRAGHLDGEGEALAVLSHAMNLQPKSLLILDELAPMVQQGELIVSLAEVLRQQILTSNDRDERAALLHSLGHIYELLAHDRDATACYENAIEIDPTHIETIKALDRLYTRYESWPALVRLYTNEAGNTEDTERGANAHVRAATILEEQLGDIEPAMEQFARALVRVPSHPVAFKSLVRLYRQRKRFRELVELYDRGAQIATTPTQSVSLLFQAANLWEDALDDPNRAAAIYERILEHEPGNLAAVQGLQRVTERAGRYRELVAALELELTLSSDETRNLMLRHRVATILEHQLKDPDAAIDQLRKILDIDPTHPPALATLGSLYRKSGRWEELLDIYERELIRAQEGRNAAILLHKMGELCERCLGDDDAAIEHFRRALEHDPGYRPALRAVAQLLRSRKDWAALVEVLKREAEEATDDQLRALSWYRVGEVYEYHRGDIDQAARAYELAVACVEGHRPSLAALTRIRHERKDWHSLLADLATEIEITPDDTRRVSFALLRGEIYRDELGDFRKAIACFEAVLGSKLGRIPALLALESLYAKVDDYDNLAATYRAIAEASGDPQAKVAALRQMTRVMETQGVGTRDMLLAAYDHLLELVPGDLDTLLRLEELAQSSADAPLAERVYELLAQSTDDQNLRAHYLTNLAAALEAQEDFRALDVYRQAVAENVDQLSAIRGLARLAEAVGDTAAIADAKKLEADQTSDPKVAAELLVKSARFRLTFDAAGGIDDLRKSLELYPEHEDAAGMLSKAMHANGRVEELVDDLSAAARACRDSSRKAELWVQVAELLADELGRFAAAIAAVQRGLVARPDHITSLLRLADLHQHEGQWRDAVRALEQVLAASKERDLYCTVQLQLATLWDEHLDDFERAEACVKAILARHALHHGALSRQASFELRQGQHEQAAKTLRRLITECRDSSERAEILLRLAEVETERGDEKASEEAIKEAFSLEGPGGRAAEVYRGRAETQGTWIGYAAVLAGHLQEIAAGTRERPAQAELIAAYQELARTYDQGMGLPQKAQQALEDGLRATENAPELHVELTERLRKAGRTAEALRQANRILRKDASIEDAWRLYSKLFADMGEPAKARYVLHPLEVLEADVGAKKQPARILSSPVSIEAINDLAPERATTNPAAALLAAAAEAAGKLFPPALDHYGVSQRERLTARSSHPLRAAADRIAEIFSIEAFELYVHDGRTPLLSLELTEPTSIVLASSAARLSGPQQAFLLSYAMVAIAARFHPAIRLSARELELFLAASARAVIDSVSSPLAPEARLQEHALLVKRSVSRRWRRAFELAAVDYARTRLNVAHWQQSLLHTAIRSALIVCDDLKAGLQVLRQMHGLADLRGRKLVQSSRTVSELMRFWISDDAFKARRRLGLVADPSLRPPMS